VGKHGLRQIAEACYHKAHYAAALIGRIGGYKVDNAKPFFNEFVVRCPMASAEVSRRLLERGIIGGLDVSEQVENGMLVCVTEMNTREEIERLAAGLAEVGGK
jgi:glycine dehydrogenase subunit 1